MSAPRTSAIWKIAPEELNLLVQNSTSYKQVLSNFGLDNKGSNYKTLLKRMTEEHINFSHFKTCQDYLISFKKTYSKVSDLLKENSSFNRTKLKKIILKEGLLKNICSICGQLPVWNDKPLVLQLDHINGISNDNRLENLRMLCPHCHSQTDNFAGKNKKLRK